MGKKILKKIIVILVVVLLIVGLVLIIGRDDDLVDSISYKGKEYVCLEYNMDIFTYHFNSNDYYEEGMIHPISHDKWDMVYLDGDLFVFSKQVEKAKRYYSNDKNYDWFIRFDDGDLEKTLDISITDDELKYIYGMDDMEYTETRVFDEIEKFASIVKISKDKTVFSLISLARYDGVWYWKSEIIDVDKENDPEYVVLLPSSLNKKIDGLLNN